MTISIIAALAQTGVIGANNSIPWSLPDDMKYFRKITMGTAPASQDGEHFAWNHVIMGRKNWESIPEKYRPLPQRMNWILTRDIEKFAKNTEPIPNTFVIDNLERQIALIEEGEIFIIGGGEIYTLAMPMVNRMYLTEIKANIDGDVVFPDYDTAEWKEVSRVHHGIDEKHKYEFDFVVYEKA